MAMKNLLRPRSLRRTRLNTAFSSTMAVANFLFGQLPRIAQIAPSKALSLADLDCDGDLDIVLGQNFFGPQSETGRYDGGLGQILVNDGIGNFTPLAPRLSGVVVREAATAIQVGDVDGDERPDIAIATNNGPVRIFVGQKDE